MTRPPARPPSLALALIARDEARCITRCLDSVRPWVDRLLVLDTGSSDDTIALARAAGARVETLAWPDDFAAARNHALALADADWTLVLDADEWIARGGEHLRAATRGPAEIGLLEVVSSFDLDGRVAHQRSWLPRLLPRGVRYAGRVHEQPVSDRPRRRLDVTLGHDGYREARRAAKRQRNLPLLQRELQDRPDDPYVRYQLGKDRELDEQFGEACEHYEAALAQAPARAGWRHDLVVRLLYSLGRAGRAAQALALAEAQLPLWPDSPDFFFTLGNLLLDQAVADPAQALDHWLPLAEAAWLRCLEVGERPDLDGHVQGRGSWLAAHNLAVILEGQGQTDRARAFRARAEPPAAGLTRLPEPADPGLAGRSGHAPLRSHPTREPV